MTICREAKCSERARYNIKGKPVKYCVDHSTVDTSTGKDGMISRPTSFCTHNKKN